MGPKGAAALNFACLLPLRHGTRTLHREEDVRLPRASNSGCEMAKGNFLTSAAELTRYVHSGRLSFPATTRLL